MSAADFVKAMAIVLAAALLLKTLSANAQQVQRQPTIADCPKGYVLGVQDTADAQPISKSQYPASAQNGTTAPGDISTEASPRAFVTGCVPKVSQQRR